MVATRESEVAADLALARAGIAFTIPFLCAINVPTGDGRLFRAIDIADLPMPFRCQFADDEGHRGAVVVGKLTDVVANEDGTYSATGYYDPTADGIAAATLAASESMPGVSMEVDEFDAQVVGDELDIAHARIRGATQLAIPAWAEARVVVEGAVPDSASTIVAAAEPGWAPPAEWFDDPHLEGPTPLTITADGRVFGHLALFDACHIGYDGACVNPPASSVDYAYFNTGAVLCAGGARVACGVLTFGSGHADTRLSAKASVDHYDNTCTVGAYVRAGEDRWGPWLAGAVAPDVSETQLRVLRASAPSGDWRRIGSNLELVAALAVNVPGFPVPRPAVVVADGRCTALVAAVGVEVPAVVETIDDILGDVDRYLDVLNV